MRARLALPAERVHVVHNGLDARAYSPPASLEGPPTIGYVARLHRDKGLGTLIEAFLLLKQRP
jgi:glycosyltransferase involved in cell wall biosynthesis